jgi:hypothetical protein
MDDNRKSHGSAQTEKGSQNDNLTAHDTEESSEGASWADTSGGLLTLFLLAVSADKGTARGFGIPIADVHDAQPMEIPIRFEEQHQWLAPWVRLFEYAGASVRRSEVSYYLEPNSSWHSLLFGSLKAKAAALVEPDEFWEETVLVQCILIETLSARVVDHLKITAPDDSNEKEKANE